MIAWAIKGPDGIDIRSAATTIAESSERWQELHGQGEWSECSPVQVEVREVEQNAAGQNEGKSEPGLSEAERSERADAATSPDRPAASAAPDVLADRFERALITYGFTESGLAREVIDALRQSGAGMKAMATKLVSDPYDERTAPWFSREDLRRLEDLPAGTVLYAILKERT